LSSVKEPTRWLAFMRRSPRTSIQRKRKWHNFLLHIAVNQATVNIAVINIATTIKATNATAMIDNLTIVIETIDSMIVLAAITRTQGATSPMTIRMIAGAITLRKRAMRPCMMTSPLCQAPAICLEEGVNLVPDLLHLQVLGLALAQAAGATLIIMLTKTIAGQVQPPSTGIHPSTGICTPRTMMTDITIARSKAILSLPPSPLQRQRRIAPRNRELHQ
jgi:hypothetical protein